MANTKVELNELFAIHPVTELPPDVLGELQSMLRLHSISPQELLYKWESYSMKMGMDQASLDLGTARALKKDLQEILERDSRGKAHVRSVDKRGAFATPKAGKDGNVFDMSVRSALWPKKGSNGFKARWRCAEYSVAAAFNQRIQAQSGLQNPSYAQVC